ncbi:MAG: peptidase M64 N-terminal domain-containing protein, partial [Hoylesella buccalis]
MNIKTFLTHVLTCILCLFMSANVNAQDFNTAFSDSTLRIDYSFSGNANQQHIAVDQLNVM